MTEDNVICMIIENMENQFPKICGSCGTVFNNYRDFLLETKRLGPPQSYDDEFDRGEQIFPRKPTGAFIYYNCPCNSTIVLGSKGMGIIKLIRLMFWWRREAKARGLKISELLEDIQNKVEERVLKSDDRRNN